MIDRAQFLSLFDENSRLPAARIFDCVQQALREAEPVYTDFLDPEQRNQFLEKLRFIPELRVLSYGGYKEAERQRLVFIPAYYFVEMVNPKIAAIETRVTVPASGGETLTHRDFLGSLIHIGIKREKFGDLWVTPGGCQVIVDEDIADYIVRNWQQVKHFRLQADIIDLERLQFPAQKRKSINTTVPSLRLDAVASAGFTMSRSKMLQEIKASKVKVNWRVVANPDYKVSEGDVLSLTGRGRMILAKVGGLTKKERIFITIERYI